MPVSLVVGMFEAVQSLRILDYLQQVQRQSGELWRRLGRGGMLLIDLHCCRGTNALPAGRAIACKNASVRCSTHVVLCRPTWNPGWFMSASYVDACQKTEPHMLSRAAQLLRTSRLTVRAVGVAGRRLTKMASANKSVKGEYCYQDQWQQSREAKGPRQQVLYTAQCQRGSEAPLAAAEVWLPASLLLDS